MCLTQDPPLGLHAALLEVNKKGRRGEWSGGNVYSHWVTDRTQGGKGGGHHMKDVLQGRIKGVISRKLLLSFLLHLRICSFKVSTNR